MKSSFSAEAVHDDVYNSGTDSTDGAGNSDKCTGITGSDQCNDGSPAQDVCIDSSSYGQHDTCPGGSPAVDTCDPAINSDDYCNTDDPTSDEYTATSDEDQCPGGGSDQDVCPSGGSPEDVCTGSGGCSGGDIPAGSTTVTDNCEVSDGDACTMAPPDNPE